MSDQTKPPRRRKRDLRTEAEIDEEAAWEWWRQQMNYYFAEHLLPSELQYHGLFSL